MAGKLVLVFSSSIQVLHGWRAPARLPTEPGGLTARIGKNAIQDGLLG
jgi:hypothetical protein